MKHQALKPWALSTRILKCEPAPAYRVPRIRRLPEEPRSLGVVVQVEIESKV